MKTSSATAQILIAALLFLAGVIALAVQWSAWPWETIGIQLALAGVVLMLLRDRIEEYGNSFEGKADAEQLANSAWRPFARQIHPLIYAIGIPLVLLGALFQAIGNPADKLILRAKEIPERVVFLPKGSEKLTVDLSKLGEALSTLEKNQIVILSAVGSLYYPDLIVVNCDATAECACPDGYVRVKDTGKWNLNAGTKGDSITLCWMKRMYEEGAK